MQRQHITDLRIKKMAFAYHLKRKNKPIREISRIIDTSYSATTAMIREAEKARKISSEIENYRGYEW